MTKLFYDSNAENLKSNLQKLCEFGNRNAGSIAEKMSGEFFKDECEKYGWYTKIDKFEIEAFEELSAYLTVQNRTYNGKSAFFSASTGFNGIDAELIVCTNDVESKDCDQNCTGKIIVIFRDKQSDHSPILDQVIFYQNLGAVGIVIINYDKWAYVKTLETGYFNLEKRFGAKVTIPVVTIGDEDGQQLLNQIYEGKNKAKLVSEVINEKRFSSNVIAKKQGISENPKKIVVYGHRDSAGTLGANDNGSGTVIMMEICRALSNQNLKYTVELASFGAEEHLGSLGSNDYLSRYKDDLEEIVASIEIDMVGAGSSLYVMTGGDFADVRLKFSENLCNYVCKMASHMGYYINTLYSDAGTPDSGRFCAAGIPTTWLWGPDDIYYHSPEDTLDKVDINRLKYITDIITTCILNISDNQLTFTI